jgi:hypothetical protein
MHLKRTHPGPWVVVSLHLEHTNHQSVESLSNSIYSGLGTVVHSINELSDEQVALFVKLHESHIPTPCIRQMFANEGVDITKQTLQNLSRKLKLKNVIVNQPSYSFTSMEGVPETLQLLGELQNEGRIFLVRFFFLKQSKIQKEISILKFPSQPPMKIEQWKEQHKSVYEFICHQEGYATQPLPSLFSSSTPLPSSPQQMDDFQSEPSSRYPSSSSSSSFVLKAAKQKPFPPSSNCAPQTAIEMLGEEWKDVLSHNEIEVLRFGGCVWTDQSSLLLASLYPEVLIMDTTCKTNMFNFPLAFLVGVDAENKSQNWLTSLLPNQQRSTFNWLLRVLSGFLGPDWGLRGVHDVINDVAI